MAGASQQPDVKPGNGFETEEQRRISELKHAETSRQKQALQLQRENILSQRTSNPGRRAALAAALSQVEGQLAALENA